MLKKDQKPTPKYDSQQKTRVLLEQIRNDVKMIAKQRVDIIKKLDEYIKRFDRFEMTVIQNTIQIKELKIGQDKIEKKLDTAIDNHEKRIHKLETKISV